MTFTFEGTFLEGRSLVARFDDRGGMTVIHFERTRRVPDDRKPHPPPSTLGRMPMRYVTDFEVDPPLEWADEDVPIRVPQEWSARGGVIMPVHPSEAMRIGFASDGYPCAIKIGTGEINAIN